MCHSQRVSSTHTLPLAGVDLVYDVHGPMPRAGGRPPLVLIGQPMDASGFTSLVPQLPDRTVVTYDPRGLGRSVRKDGRLDHVPQVQAADVHAVIEALGGAPVELFASSGGAVTALALVTDFPDDVATVVAHEPPLTRLLPDADAAARAYAGVRAAYAENGWGAGMAEFIAMTSWQGEFTDEYFTAPRPGPAAFGLPAEDDGAREDPLLSEHSAAVVDYQPDLAALTAAPTRLLVAAGEESAGTLTARTAEALAAALGQQVVIFPSHHAGFAGGEFGQAGQPEAFGRRLREVLGE
ncbi:MAG TPA: alpha/beta hydrolase [Candidatus Ruania gallistercoris]|uniref:Alpha/beta hydrolase n=1 Tax=Candidatus Ruania gallistercoris TaxID=2838746 RepID=A0A9D2EG78_9MICO|nr:alpha/beta hydrolase [Candidatus Ruania gallistercoris]